MKVKKTSTLVFFLLKPFFRLALFLFYGFRFDHKSSKGIKRPCLILSNHSSGFDQFAVALGFTFGMNFVATDTLFRHGLLSKIMVALVRPIPYSKGSSDLAAIKNMISVTKDGGAVVLFPSGNRSFFGKESTIFPGIGKLAKKLNVPLVLVQLRGGYFTMPRWMPKRNRGKMRAVVSRIVQPDEMTSMSNEELDRVILNELSFDDFEYNKSAKIIYRGKRKAEYLESVLFYCPRCHSFDGLSSSGNEIFCTKCNIRAIINDYCLFEPINAAEIPETILEWGNLQLKYIKNFDFSGFTEKPVFSDDNVGFYKAERAKKEELLSTGLIELYTDRLRVCGVDFPLSETTTSLEDVSIAFPEEFVIDMDAPHFTSERKYRNIHYSTNGIEWFLESVQSDALSDWLQWEYEWGRPTPNQEPTQPMLFGVIKHYNITYKEFERASKKLYLYMLEEDNDMSREVFEIPNPDMLYTFNLEQINDYHSVDPARNASARKWLAEWLKTNKPYNSYSEYQKANAD